MIIACSVQQAKIIILDMCRVQLGNNYLKLGWNAMCMMAGLVLHSIAPDLLGLRCTRSTRVAGAPDLLGLRCTRSTRLASARFQRAGRLDCSANLIFDDVVTCVLSFTAVTEQTALQMTQLVTVRLERSLHDGATLFANEEERGIF